MNIPVVIFKMSLIHNRCKNMLRPLFTTKKLKGVCLSNGVCVILCNDLDDNEHAKVIWQYNLPKMLDTLSNCLPMHLPKFY